MGDKGLGLLLGFGKPKGEDDSSEDESSSKGMACKAMFKAIKSDDYEGFSEALDLYLDARKPKAEATDDDE